MKKLFAITIVFCILVAGCTDSKSRSTGVYMLLDTSGTYAVELKKAQKILNYLLGVLAPGDTLAVARIDTGSFSEKDIVSKITFDDRPSVANNQKKGFHESGRHVCQIGERQPLYRYLRWHPAGNRIFKRSWIRQKIYFNFL